MYFVNSGIVLPFLLSRSHLASGNLVVEGLATFKHVYGAQKNSDAIVEFFHGLCLVAGCKSLEHLPHLAVQKVVPAEDVLLRVVLDVLANLGKRKGDLLADRFRRLAVRLHPVAEPRVLLAGMGVV